MQVLGVEVSKPAAELVINLKVVHVASDDDTMVQQVCERSRREDLCMCC